MNSNHADMDDQAEFGVAYNSDRVKMTDTEIDRAVKQREEIESWHLPHMARLIGGGINSAQSAAPAIAPAEACSEVGADSPEWESADSEVLIYLCKLLACILAFCFLAWAVA